MKGNSMKNFRFFIALLLVATLSLAAMAQIPASNLQLWLKADVGVDTLNGKVSRWHDQSGKQNDAIQLDSVRQPLFVGSELNQKPVLRFDGFNDKLGFTGSTPMSQFTLFMVVKNYSGGGEHNSHVINFGPSGADWNKWFFVLWGGLDRVPDTIDLGEGPIGGMFANAPNIAINGKWMIISIVYQTKFNTKLRWNENNATMTVFDPGPSFFGPMGDPTGSGGGIAGADGVPNGNLLTAKCDFAEAIVYDTLLTDSEILGVENYLTEKYNIILGIEDLREDIIPVTLSQNYPNPFNPSTTIHFSVSSSEFVTLKVYDVLGNKVATLVNEEKSTGSYKVDFNAANLKRGIYFYSIQVGTHIETKKMVLIK
jgi:hypothetical protein